MALSQHCMARLAVLLTLVASASAQDMTVKFTLRGLSGKEKVNIVGPNGDFVADGVTLSTTEQTFEAQSPFKVTFLNDAVGSDVFMKMVGGMEVSDAVDIEHPNFSGWNCGSSNENTRCNSVRIGTFAWSGTYTITAKALKTTIGTTIGMTLRPQSLNETSSDVAKELSKRHAELVLPMIKEGHLDDTSLVTELLKKLGKKAEKVKAAKIPLDSADAKKNPDTLADTCLLEENSTLAAWKYCNDTLAVERPNETNNCKEMDKNGIGSYTIDKSDAFDISYKLDTTSTPKAKCNFETYTLEGTDTSCDDFVDDIIGMANAEFSSQFGPSDVEGTFSYWKQRCDYSRPLVADLVVDCAAKGKAHRDKQAECVVKDTSRKVALCKLQMALKSKCTTLANFYKAVTDLTKQEEDRNKELRIVSHSKCLLDDYSEKTGVCFKESVNNDCEKMVNGASEEYASAAAEQIHTFREEAKVHITEFTCEAMSLVIGVDGLSYEKENPSVEFSFYTKVDPLTFSVSSLGDFSPAVCV